MALKLILTVVVFILAVVLLTSVSDRASEHTRTLANSMQATGIISTRTSWGSSG